MQEALLFDMATPGDGGQQTPLQTTTTSTRRVEKIRTKDLRKLLEKQKYCCALTGRPLTPDIASLDHIMPIGRGGDHSIDNLQIVHRDANYAKRTLTQSEFIQLCRDVVAHADANSVQPRGT